MPIISKTIEMIKIIVGIKSETIRISSIKETLIKDKISPTMIKIVAIINFLDILPPTTYNAFSSAD